MKNQLYKIQLWHFGLLMLSFLLISSLTFAQIATPNPEIDRQSDDNTDILNVELRDNQTVVRFSYIERGQESVRIGNRGMEIVRTPHSISINPESYLRIGSKKYKFIKATGLPLLPNETTIEVGEKIRFSVYFERLEAGEELFDFIEGKNAEGASRHFWNFYGVHITNPAKKSTENPSVAKPVLATKIIIKGKVLDAKTNQPIAAKIILFSGNSSKKIDSVITKKTGEYRFELKPDDYNFATSSNGYETSQEEYDLSSVTGKGSFSKNITLNPVAEIAKIEKKAIKIEEKPAKIEPKIDSIKTIEKPVLVEENKFRLDKVYFNIGDANLLPTSFAQLDGLLKMMKENPAMTIQVEGHTDNLGEAALNKRLSLDRAFSVREYLISKGIAGNRIKFKGFGDTKPISTNETEEGRRENRRVEFLILSQ